MSENKNLTAIQKFLNEKKMKKVKFWEHLTSHGHKITYPGTVKLINGGCYPAPDTALEMIRVMNEFGEYGISLQDLIAPPERYRKNTEAGNSERIEAKVCAAGVRSRRG